MRVAARWFVAAGGVAVACSSFLRLRSAGPWSYDEYYHFALAREILANGFPSAFPWTPLSILAQRFADKEPLFHLLIAPFSGLSLDLATAVVVVLGQLLLCSLVALFLWRSGVRWGPWCVLATAGLGPMVALRFGMARPHLLLMASSVGFLALLGTRRGRWDWRGLAWLSLVAAASGLAHTAGWIVVVFAAVYGIAGSLDRAAPADARRVEWRPLAAAAGGWLVGQLIHPNLPQNFHLLWVQNVVVPFQAAGAGSEALESMIGVELRPLTARGVAQQWPAFLFLAMAAWRLAVRPSARTRVAVTLTALAFLFVLAAVFAFRRFFELGAPLAVLAAALADVEGEAWRGRGKRLAATLLLMAAIAWSQSFLVRQPSDSYPRGMSAWLGSRARPGDVVFTPQWADSAPLFYSAAQTRSLVALDPTFFYLEDPALFRLFTLISYGGVADSARAIRERFGARWVTIWKMPAYQPLSSRLKREGGARRVYEDQFYEVWYLDPVPAGVGLGLAPLGLGTLGGSPELVVLRAH